jgi:DNA (cytosine-5)-methyltransferase 1
MVVRNELERLGYRVAETLVRASDVGAPHQRERVFILGYADHLRLREGGHAKHVHVRSEPAAGSGAVADAASRAPGLEVTWNGRQGAIEGGQAVADACRDGVGRDSGSASGSQEKTQMWSDGERTRGIRHACFPPGPGDRRAWAAIIGEYPELAPSTEPTVCGVADGVAGAMEHSTQRLRLLGNGVVPLAAAVAFRTLADTLGLAIEELRHTHTEGMDESTKPADS